MKTFLRLIIGIVIAGVVVIALGALYFFFFFSMGFVSYEDEIEIINRAVAKNDISICEELPKEMYGDDTTYPRQKCINKFNFAKYTNEGPEACSVLNGRERFDCLIQAAYKKNDISICEKIPSDTLYLDRFCGTNRRICTGESLRGECIQRFNLNCKQSPNDFEGCLTGQSNHL